MPPSFFVSQGLSHHSSFTRERSFERKRKARACTYALRYTRTTHATPHTLSHTPFLFLPCLPPLNTPQREKMRRTRRFHYGKCTHRGFHQARRRQCKSKIHSVKKNNGERKQETKPILNQNTTRQREREKIEKIELPLISSPSFPLPPPYF